MPKRVVVWVLIILAIGALMFLFGSRILLYVNYILGNDVTLSLSVDKPILTMTKGDTQQVQFEAQLQANPFCNAKCSSIFQSLASGTVVDMANFTLEPGSMHTNNYSITEKRYGIGQELYSYTMNCKSVQTNLCQTAEQTSSRTIVVVVNYTLNSDETAQKNIQKQRLDTLVSQVNQFLYRQANLKAAVQDAGTVLNMDEQNIGLIQLNQTITTAMLKLTTLKAIWKMQDLVSLPSQIDATNKFYSEVSLQISMLNSSLQKVYNRYNNLVRSLNSTEKTYSELSGLYLNNQLPITDLNKLIALYNGITTTMNSQSTIAKKESYVQYLDNQAKLLGASSLRDISSQTIQHEVDLAVNYQILCTIVQNQCSKRLSMDNITNQTKFNLKQTCRQVADFNRVVTALQANTTVDSTAELELLRNSIINSFLKELNQNGRNSDQIRQVLGKASQVQSTNFSNLSKSLLKALQSQLPEECPDVNGTVLPMVKPKLTTLSRPNSYANQFSFDFGEPQPVCCLFEKCQECCTTTDCRNNETEYPVILVHGHAFNQATTFEYSLDAFNQIQQTLDTNGYVNVGSLSTYITSELPEATFGMINEPISLKASYYLDFYKQPENYVIVQTKSENIDSYALRLKSIVDSVKFITGRPKVVIIAHSMGGLVTRRYLQIFGTADVSKMILIAVPNKGIVGQVADYCPIVGAKLECEDMNSNSLFMNKLNSGSLPDMPIYNIVGIGCKMQNGAGDGIVFEQNEILTGAKNYFINGTCSGINLLHTDLLDISKYPETYSIISQALKN